MNNKIQITTPAVCFVPRNGGVTWADRILTPTLCFVPRIGGVAWADKKANPEVQIACGLLRAFMVGAEFPF